MLGSNVEEIADRLIETGLDSTAVLLDRQPLWLGALASVLERHGIVTLATSTNASAALADVERFAPTTFVLDPWMEDAAMTGLDLVALLRRRLPALKIVCLGATDSLTQVDAAFAAGADAYVLKLAAADDVAQAIKHVCSELMFFAAPSAPRHRAPVAQASDRGSAAAELTKRELEILRVVAEGKANGEIARMLWVTEQTVKFHLSNIYRKLGVSNRTEAGRWAHLNGLVSLDGEAGRDGETLDGALLRAALAR